jgi:regulatory LuxR family protein
VAGHGTGQIAKELGISRKTIETHGEHIKLKLGYPDAIAAFKFFEAKRAMVGIRSPKIVAFSRARLHVFWKRIVQFPKATRAFGIHFSPGQSRN